MSNQHQRWRGQGQEPHSQQRSSEQQPVTSRRDPRYASTVRQSPPRAANYQHTQPNQQQQPGVHQPGYPQQHYPTQGYPTPGYPPAGYPTQAFPVQTYPTQGYTQQGYPQTGYPQSPASHQCGHSGVQAPYQGFNPYSTFGNAANVMPPYTNQGAAPATSSVRGWYDPDTHRWSPKYRFFTRHPQGDNYEWERYQQGLIPFPIYSEKPPPISARTPNQPLRRSSGSNRMFSIRHPRRRSEAPDDHYEEDNSYEAEQSRSNSRDHRSRRHRHSKEMRPSRNPEPPKQARRSVSIEELLASLKVPGSWVDDCLERAWDFGRRRPEVEHVRVERAVNSKRFADWAWEDGAQILLLREPASRSDNEIEEIEASEFTILSHCVAGLSEDMIEHRNVFPLVFFCGAYRELKHSAERVHIYLLRSFCRQLLSVQGLQFDPAELGYDDKFLERLELGDANQLLQLFNDLVVEFARSGNTLVCFIDGVHVIEDAKDGFEIFRGIFQTFEGFAEAARESRDFDFKVLLTLPQQTNKDWEQLDRGRIVVVNLPRN